MNKVVLIIVKNLFIPIWSSDGVIQIQLIRVFAIIVLTILL